MVAADRPALIQGATVALQDGKAVFRDLSVTDSTYNLIKKSQALLVFSCHQAGGVTSAVTAPFRVLTKRSKCDNLSGPAKAGGSRRPRCEDFTAQDSIRALPGLGFRSTERLMAAGVSSVGQLATALSKDEAQVRRVMGNVGINSKSWKNVLQHTGAWSMRALRFIHPRCDVAHATPFFSWNSAPAACRRRRSLRGR